MIIKRLTFIVSTVVALIFAHTSYGNTVRNGVLDLRTNNISNLKPVKIQGDVKFYWEQLLTPLSFSDSASNPKPLLVSIPKSWSSYSINGKKLPSAGYGTYRFSVIVNSNTTENIFGLRVPTVFSSYKVWANGKLVSEVGNVSESSVGYNPQFKHHDIPIIVTGNDQTNQRIDIIIQVANFSHRRAGLAWPMYFSTFESLRNDSRMMDILNLIIIGIILIISINHLNMFIFRRADRSNLYFGLVCLIMILRNISTGDRIIGFLFTDINWELLVKLDNFSGFGTIPFFALFLYSIFKEEFPKWVRNAMVIFGLAISVFVFATPAMVYGKFRIVFEIFTLISGLYLTFGVLLVASFRKRSSALLTFIGFFILYATAVNDVLSSMGVIQTAYIAPYGLVTFMLLQSITITSKSARAINENEELSHQLEAEKHSLEERIEERTKELQQQHNELIAHQEKETRQNWVNVGLTTINDVLSESKHDFSLMSQNVLSSLAKYVDARMGALYILNDDNASDSFLELAADYGCANDFKQNRSRVDVNSGILGAAFSDNETKHLTNIPDDFIRINSGLGEAKAASVLIVPLSLDDSVFGAVELASFNEFQKHEIEFIQKIAFSMATNLNTVRMNERNLKLIQQFQLQTSDMQEKEERIRLSLEELEYYREQYETLKRKLDEDPKLQAKPAKKKGSKEDKLE